MSDTIPTYITKFYNCPSRPEHYVHVEHFLEEPCISVLEHGKVRSRREPPLHPGDIYVAMFPKIKWSFCWYAPFFLEIKQVLAYNAFVWIQHVEDKEGYPLHLRKRFMGWAKLPTVSMPPRLWAHIQEKSKIYVGKQIW